MEYLFIFFFAVLAIVFVLAGMGIVHLVAPIHPHRIKNSPYECGEKTIGDSWVQFNVGYYLFGLIFLVFDVEAAFLFPWAVAFRDLGVIGFVEAGVFIVILIVALIYAWKKGALEWV